MVGTKEDQWRAAGKITRDKSPTTVGATPHHEWRGYASNYRLADGVLDCAWCVLTDRTPLNLDHGWLGWVSVGASEALSG